MNEDKRHDPPALLTVDDVAKRFAVSRKTVRAYVALRLLPGAIRVGRAIRFDGAALDEWCRRGGRAWNEGGA